MRALSQPLPAQEKVIDEFGYETRSAVRRVRSPWLFCLASLMFGLAERIQSEDVPVCVTQSLGMVLKVVMVFG